MRISQTLTAGITKPGIRQDAKAGARAPETGSEIFARVEKPPNTHVKAGPLPAGYSYARAMKAKKAAAEAFEREVERIPDPSHRKPFAPPLLEPKTHLEDAPLDRIWENFRAVQKMAKEIPDHVTIGDAISLAKVGVEPDRIRAKLSQCDLGAFDAQVNRLRHWPAR